MARPDDQTRRDFLVRLARTTAFVPPLIATVGVGPLFAGGKGNSNAAAHAAANSAVGSLSPTAQAVSNPTFNVQPQSPSTAVPWAPGQASQPPPWASPPPTQTGR